MFIPMLPPRVVHSEGDYPADLLLDSEKGLRFLKIRGPITRLVQNPCPFLQPS
jgi:hypothetical protein